MSELQKVLDMEGIASGKLLGDSPDILTIAEQNLQQELIQYSKEDESSLFCMLGLAHMTRLPGMPDWLDHVGVNTTWTPEGKQWLADLSSNGEAICLQWH